MRHNRTVLGSTFSSTSVLWIRFSYMPLAPSIDIIFVGKTSLIHNSKVCTSLAVRKRSLERQGLPENLDEWLFPLNSSTRDIPTLQVLLGHNDEFFAFDKFDRISHINAELRESGCSLFQTSSINIVINPVPQLARRQKSHTFSHSD